MSDYVPLNDPRVKAVWPGAPGTLRTLRRELAAGRVRGVRIGRRVFVDVPALGSWVENQANLQK